MKSLPKMCKASELQKLNGNPDVIVSNLCARLLWLENRAAVKAKGGRPSRTGFPVWRVIEPHSCSSGKTPNHF